jgi:GT2 family glycosyltransferase
VYFGVHVDNTSLSIIITVFNQQHFLERALRSCITQQVDRLEILVIDDGSEPEIFLPNVGRVDGVSVRLLRKANGGVASARNLGIWEAKGTFLKFLDCDDELLPDCCSAQLASIRSELPELSIIGYRVQQGMKWVEGVPKFDGLIPALFQGNLAPLHAFLYRSKDVRAIGGFDQTERTLETMEDYDFNLRMALRGVIATTIHRTGVVYHKQLGSRSADTQKLHQASIRIIDYALEEILQGRVEHEPCLLDILHGVILHAVQSQDYRSFLPLIPRLKSIKTSSSLLLINKLQWQVQGRLALAKSAEESMFWQQVLDLAQQSELESEQLLNPPSYSLRASGPLLAVHYFDGILLGRVLAKSIQSKGLWLWGTGVWADYWLMMLGSFDITPKGFIDSAATTNMNYKNLACYQLDQIPPEQIEHVIICSRDGYQAILAAMTERNMADRVLHYVTL